MQPAMISRHVNTNSPNFVEASEVDLIAQNSCFEIIQQKEREIENLKKEENRKTKLLFSKVFEDMTSEEDIDLIEELKNKYERIEWKLDTIKSQQMIYTDKSFKDIINQNTKYDNTGTSRLKNDPSKESEEMMLHKVENNRKLSI